MKARKVCHCDAYKNKRTGEPFPHRKYSGKCYADEIEAEEERAHEESDRWLEYHLERGCRGSADDRS